MRRRRDPSRDHATGSCPFDGPRTVRFAGWYGSTATIWEPSLYVMHPWTRTNLSVDWAVPEMHSCGAGPGFTTVGCQTFNPPAMNPITIAIVTRAAAATISQFQSRSTRGRAG